MRQALTEMGAGFAAYSAKLNEPLVSLADIDSEVATVYRECSTTALSRRMWKIGK
jgi:hypothetical protein